MTGRPSSAQLGRSPLEAAAVAVALAAFLGVGTLWAVGVLIGSIFGSSIPGTVSEGIAAMLRSFPDIGAAWQPPTPSGLIWFGAAALIVGFTPLIWRLARVGRLAEEGAQWATTMELRRAGLLVSDRALPYARPEEPSDAT